jgi:hypothetical protein
MADLARIPAQRRRFRSSPYNLGVSPTDLNRIAIGAAGGFIDITTNGGATWTDIDLITAGPRLPGLRHQHDLAGQQNLWITSVAQATGAVRVIKASIATPSLDLVDGHLHRHAERPARPAGHARLSSIRATPRTTRSSRRRTSASTARPTAARTGIRTATACRPCASTTSTCRRTAASPASPRTAAASGSCAARARERRALR